MWLRLAMMVAVGWLGWGATCVDQGPVEQPGGASPAVESDDDVPTDDVDEERPVNTTDDDTSLSDAGTADDDRAAFTSGLDLTTLRSEIIRQDGTLEDVGDDELYLSPGNRARIFITVVNASDGWVPINFELCTDNHEAVTVIDAEAVSGPNGEPDPEYSDDRELLSEPCRVRFRSGEWPVIERDTSAEFLTGAVSAYPHPAGGYLTIRFRAEFEALGEMDLYEYTVPYRVLPSHEASAAHHPRRAVLRRLVLDLP